jgi:hypothetical protein
MPAGQNPVDALPPRQKFHESGEPGRLLSGVCITIVGPERGAAEEGAPGKGAAEGGRRQPARAGGAPHRHVACPTGTLHSCWAIQVSNRCSPDALSRHVDEQSQDAVQRLHACFRKLDTRLGVVVLQLQLARVQRREADLRKRMLNVVAAHNVALEGFEARTKAVAEKTKMIVAR